MRKRDAGGSGTEIHAAEGSDLVTCRDEGDVLLLSELEVDALVRWARVGVTVSYEDAKTTMLETAARRAAETGVPFTLDDITTESSALRASADLVREVSERIPRMRAARVLLRGEVDGNGDSTTDAGGTDPSGTLPRMLLRGECLYCDEDVDPLTRRHQGATHPGCPETGDDEFPLAVSLCCPRCGSGSIAEVNVGEVWDYVLDASLDGGFLTVTIGQESAMDRVGDGWACTSCSTRLSLPEGIAFEFEYR